MPVKFTIPPEVAEAFRVAAEAMKESAVESVKKAIDRSTDSFLEDLQNALQKSVKKVKRARTRVHRPARDDDEE